MTITMNGDAVECAQETTISTILAMRGIAPERVAVAVNGDVVPRTAWSSTTLRPSDRLELVRAVAGGSAADDDQVDDLLIAGVQLQSRLFMGTGRFPSPRLLRDALAESGTQLVTVSIRTLGLDGQGADGGLLGELDLSRYHLLPNTAGATSVRQAVYMAHLAREATGTNWIKLEVIGDERTLWPDTAGTIEACRQLVADEFVVLPYTSTDLVTALRLEEAGAACVMPLGSMIGSGQGLHDHDSIARIVQRVRVPVVVDAGIGTPSDAAVAMELGASACLINTAISRAGDPVRMATAMRLAVQAGRLGYRAGRMPRLDHAVPSSPIEGIVTLPEAATSGHGGRA